VEEGPLDRGDTAGISKEEVMNVAARKTVEWWRAARECDPKDPPAPIHMFMFRGMYRGFKKHFKDVLGHGSGYDPNDYLDPWERTKE